MKYLIIFISLCIVSCNAESTEKQTVATIAEEQLGQTPSVDTLKVFVDNQLTRIIKVDTTLSPQDAWYSINSITVSEGYNHDVLLAAPKAKAKKVKVYLIPFREELSPIELEERIDDIGFKLVDFVTLCDLNEQEMLLAMDYPNATQWRDENGNTCYAAFAYFDRKKPCKGVAYREKNWSTKWYFACVPK